MSDAVASGLAPKVYHCGSLRYTVRGLTGLFAWMLWGSFCFTLMEAVVPAILPLKLKALEAPNWVMGLVMTTLPAVLNMTICPWVSFKSDRYRSKWGRRIPFVLGSLPFLCVSLVAMGWVDPISASLLKWLPALQRLAPATVTVALIAVFMVSFSFFNMYVTSVFYYLFNDVVPAQFLGRFFGLFRMAGTLASAGFSAFVFKYADTHMREIFTGASLLYAVGMGLMCWRVKEGEYPPPPAAPQGSRLQRLAAEVRCFGRECFSHRLYWMFYLMQAFAAVAWSVGIFQVFFYRNMGLTLDQIGKFTAVGLLAGMAAMYVAAIYVDRWHPLRITAYLALFGVLTVNYSDWIWVPVTVPALVFFWLNMGNIIVQTFSITLNQNAYVPVYMRVLPPSRYGQFCSAASVIRSVGVIIAGLLAGVFIDLVKGFCHGSDFAYRFLFVWIWPLAVVYAVFTLLSYREWKRLGGDEHYQAPAPWSPDGYEDMSDKAVPVAVHAKWLVVALHLFTAAFGLFLVSLLVFLWLFQQRGMQQAFWWHALVFLPAASLVLAGWLWQVRGVVRDARARAAGADTRYGIPHHGVIMVMGIQTLVTLPLLWLRTGWTLRLGMEREVIWFGVAAVIALAANLLVLHILRVLEREPAQAPGSASISPT
ncbi:MAG: hypothetical protein MUE94_07625 [Verrucomicrobia bacterium]|jgi:MFS family permease|nr:hypothetical protein [Verrucomicrobiota bacterium]